MFYSQCLLSRKAPFGAIRVAAYCFKRLKKVQVNQTDICFSVDKILRDEINDQTYRVLAALLLGLVRIYSRKVEYLVHDCNEVLLKIKKFRINTKGRNGPMETLCATITIPQRFELDSFDLEEVTEDADGGNNIASPEEITLKGNCNQVTSFYIWYETEVWENEQIGQFSLDKDLQFQSEEFCCSLNLCSADNAMVEEEDFHQSHQMDINFEVTEPNSPTLEKQVNLGTDLVVEALAEPVNLLSQDKQVDEEKETTEGESYKDEARNNIIERIQLCGISQEDLSVSCQPFNESHRVVKEQIEARGNQIHQEAGEVHEARNSEASVETLKEHIEGSNGLTEHISMEGQKLHVTPIKSIFIDLSPCVPDASTTRPKKGSTTPKDMLIPTPTAKEGARVTRKRKSIIDDVIALSNEEIKQSLCDAGDLISKRRKRPRTPLKAWKTHRISTLPNGFHDSLLPCHSSELQSLFSRKKLKISKSFQTTETPKKLDQLESDVAASPKTPPIQSVEGTNDVTPLSPHESLRREKSLRNDEQLNLMMNEENYKSNHGIVGTLSSYESLEGDQSFRKDEEHNLMNEDSYSLETRNSPSCSWTAQTREVAMYLQRSFMNMGEQNEEEVVNFSEVFGSKTKKECARLFYEILVLKTTDFVDAKQHEAYGDISIRKLLKWDETFGTDGI